MKCYVFLTSSGNEVYIGATLSKMNLDSGRYCWTTSPEQYVKAAVINVEEGLARSGKRFLFKFVTPLLRNYAPWMEDSTELMADSMQRYQELIVKLIWAVGIGSLDILWETSLLLIYPELGTSRKHSISLDI